MLEFRENIFFQSAALPPKNLSEFFLYPPKNWVIMLQIPSPQLMKLMWTPTKFDENGIYTHPPLDGYGTLPKTSN